MRSFQHSTLLLLAFAAVTLFMTACGDQNNPPSTSIGKTAADFNNKVAYDWNELFLVTERYAAGYRPGPAPRTLAYLGLSAYEACINGMPSYQSLQNQFPGFTVPTADENLEYHWPTVLNASNGYLMPRLFPAATQAQIAAMAALEASYENRYKSEVDAEVFERSRAHGRAVAAAVFNFAESDEIGKDHYLNPFENYDWAAHYAKDGDWKPTFPGPGKPMGAVWGGARTFVLTDGEKICRKPLTYSVSPTSEMYSQALEVYAQNTPTWSYEDEWVGEFWSDDLVNLTFSPGPRWLAIGDEALKQEDSNLETALVMNAKVGLALNDASIGCWYSKYYYNVERPQTYINRVIDANWKPALDNPLTGDKGMTPSFPAYPSGHSTMGAAGAEVLASIFGYSYAMTDRCHEQRTEFTGKPRSFGSFLEMAEENAWSRVPLGVHFRVDSEEGVHFGTLIGRKVNNLPWKK